MSRMHTIPLHSVYRSVELWAGQSEAQIIEAKRQIDLVREMHDPVELAAFAEDHGNAPESRALARDMVLAGKEARQGCAVDLEVLIARTGGINRVDDVLGRMAGHHYSGWWPASWWPNNQT